MPFNRTKHIEFYDHLNHFCIHTILGAIGALYQTVPTEFDSYHRSELLLNNTELIIQLVKIYINQCWESYHQETDAHVRQIISAMLNVEVVRHPSCLFNVIVTYSQSLIAALAQLPNSVIVHMKTLDLTRDILRAILSDICQDLQSKLIRSQQSISCTSQCQPYNYTSGETICY
jgi:hypothetical protein